MDKTKNIIGLIGLMLLAGSVAAAYDCSPSDQCCTDCVADGFIYGNCLTEQLTHTFYDPINNPDYNSWCDSESGGEMPLCTCVKYCQTICEDRGYYQGGYCIVHGEIPPTDYATISGAALNCAYDTLDYNGNCVCKFTYNITEHYLDNMGNRTPCMSALMNQSIKEALKCLYIGNNFQRDDGSPTMGYFFWLIVVDGMIFVFYLRHKSIAVASMMLLIFLGSGIADFPPEVLMIHWAIAVGGILVTLYKLFEND